MNNLCWTNSGGGTMSYSTKSARLLALKNCLLLIPSFLILGSLFGSSREPQFGIAVIASGPWLVGALLNFFYFSHWLGWQTNSKITQGFWLFSIAFNSIGLIYSVIGSVNIDIYSDPVIFSLLAALLGWVSLNIYLSLTSIITIRKQNRYPLEN